MATMFPGKGVQLALASSNPQEPVWLSMRNPDYTIPDGESSVNVAVNAGLTTTVSVLFDVAPAGTAFNVMLASDPTMADEFVLKAVAATTDTFYVWSSESVTPLVGNLRVTNDGGQDINEVWVQQISATVG